jgi:demethylmenaquinone methyltransferase/2-methoxy-6-polyprenyl-1,4-benzoquinol methylase
MGRALPKEGNRIQDAETQRTRQVQIQRMFGRIVSRYDVINHVMTGGMDTGWRRLTARLVQPAGADALDVGAGTGELVRQLLRAGAHSVIAADFSRAMLDVGRRKLGQRRRLHWLVADALRLPFPDNSFDCVTSAFLLRNLVDLPAGFREMVRILRPGGRLACLDITHPGSGPIGAAYRLYFQRLLPPLAGTLSGDRQAYDYLRNSLAGFPNAEGLSRLLSQAGLQDVRYRKLGLGTVAVHWGRRLN